MKTSLLCVLLLGIVSIAAPRESIAQDPGGYRIEFLQPDGSPAKQAAVYRTANEAGGGGMMGGMMGMADMMGGGMEGMAGAMGSGGAGVMLGGGGDMGGGQLGRRKKPAPRKRIDLLATVERTTPLVSEPKLVFLPEALPEGELKLEKGQTYKSRDYVRHTSALLALHESGYCFIPPKSRVRSQVTLRAPGYVRVEAPEGIDPLRYRVIACWQNGFAWPSRNNEMQDQGFEAPLCRADDDWRFKPRFRVFAVGSLGDDLRVPPGEVRVAIVPNEIQGTPLEDIRSGDMLFEHLLYRGPSRIVVITGREKESVVVRMTVPKAVTFQIPKSKESSLPLWDGAPETRYFLVPHTREIPWAKFRGGMGMEMDDMGMGMGGMGMDDMDDMGGMAMGMGGGLGGMGGLSKDESELESIRRWSALLNEKRLQRSTNVQIREASSISQMTVRFDLIQPGHYRLIRVEDDTLVTHFQQVGASLENGSRFTMKPMSPSNKNGSQLAIFFDQKTSLGLPNIHLPGAQAGRASAEGNASAASNPSTGIANNLKAESGFRPNNIELAGGLPEGDLSSFDKRPFAMANGGTGAQSGGGPNSANPLDSSARTADSSVSPFDDSFGSFDNSAGPFDNSASPFDNTQSASPRNRSTGPSSDAPAPQLDAIRRMRSEVEAVIKKMTKHRQKLLELEKRLSGEPETQQ